jgi:catechol 2,3-dioxygenase
MLHDIEFHPAFNTTRASHIVLQVADLGASRAFYCDAMGLIESDKDLDTLYLRGLEESAHHSVVLKQTEQQPKCERVGFRVLREEDLDQAKFSLDRLGIRSDWVDVPFQNRTLHFTDPVGTPIELCASMTFVPRMMQHYDCYRSGGPQRLDHYQVVAYDVQKAYGFYNQLGFRLTEYVVSNEQLWGVWLQRKGNTHDLVFTNGQGPRLHHFAFTIRDAHDVIHLLDVAGSLGFGGCVERGPGRHAMGGGALFLYLRDPDGHRVEFFNTHYQAIDVEPPLRFDLSDPKRTDLWGMPAVERWFYEASEFVGCSTHPPTIDAKPRTLEAILSERASKNQAAAN